MFKKIMIHTRRGMKFIVLFMIAAFLIVGAVAFLYKPTYSVFINGEQVGYTENRTGLQHKINDYIEKGEGSNNVAFVQVANLPEYKLCLLKKNIVTNDDEIFNDIKQQGVTYYRYYAIVDNQEEKAYVSNFEEAENVVNGLKEKNSSNIENMSIVEKYEVELMQYQNYMYNQHKEQRLLKLIQNLQVHQNTQLQDLLIQQGLHLLQRLI